MGDVLAVGGQAEGGVGGGGQHVPVVHVQHHAGRTLHLFTGQFGDGIGQHVLYRPLQVQVDGEDHVVSRFGVGEPGLGHHLSAGVPLQGPHAGGAPEIVLKGPLRPLLAHGVVHLIVRLPVPVDVRRLIVGRPLVRVDGGHPAQEVGGVGGVILAGGGGLDDHAGEREFFHPGDEVDVHVGGKAIGRLVHALGAQQLLIQHPSRVPHLVLPQAAQVQLGQGGGLVGALAFLRLLGQVEVQAQAAQQLLRRGQRGVLLFFLGGGLIGCAVPAGEDRLELVKKARFFLDGLLVRDGLRVFRRVLNPLHLHAQFAQAGESAGLGAVLIVGEGVIGVVGGEGEGGLVGDGQGVLPLSARGPGHLEQGENGIIALLGLAHKGGVQFHLIHRLVRHQHPAVPVQDLAPSGLHGLGLGNFILGLAAIGLAVVDLKVIQHRAKPGEQQGHENHHGQHPPLKLFGIYEGASFLRRQKREKLRFKSLPLGEGAPEGGG